MFSATNRLEKPQTNKLHFFVFRTADSSTLKIYIRGYIVVISLLYKPKIGSLSSSVVERSAVNRLVVGSNPT